ncbi:MAG: PD-(D/E)XK nuclease family protein [Bacteroidales bacterium]|nr:PD-(D/E)XK nuclease family protein [Candidatus Liminaster caballi]
MLAAFNGNMQENALVLEYLSRPNIFDTIGKARNEMSHSKMIAHLLSAYNASDCRESPIVHLLDIIIERSWQQAKKFPEDLKAAILTRDLPDLQLEECKTEVPLSKLNKSYRGKERVDIYLRYRLKDTIVKSGRSEIEIIIENKVQSQEHDSQTETYYKTLKAGKGTGKYQFFLYLSPMSARTLDDFSNAKEKPTCDKFVCISYQDILDGVIEPLLAGNELSDRERVILNDYVSCLELPALPDTNKDGVQDKFDMSIMATSAHERRLINNFLSTENNRQLIQLATSSVCGIPSYTYKEKAGLTFEEALPLALADYVNEKTELGVMVGTYDVFARTKGGTPFVVWSPNGKQYVPFDLWETEGEVYSKFYEAAAHAIISYSERIGKRYPSEVISDFNSEYGKRNGKRNNGKPLLLSDPMDGYELIQGDFFIRKDVGTDCTIASITEIAICHVSHEAFHNLLMSDIATLKYFLLDFNPDLYSRIPGTNFYYRHDSKDKIDVINKCLKEKKIEKITFSQDDRNLLKKFYDSHRGLILSVHKIKADNEQNASRYEAQQGVLKKLLKYK